MRPNRIRLIELGLDPDFAQSFEQLSSTIEAINAEYGKSESTSVKDLDVDPSDVGQVSGSP